MKKVVIALVAVCATMLVNAASVYWTCTNVYHGNGTDKTSGIAYLMLSSDVSASDFSALAGKGSAAVLSALESAKTSYTGADGLFTLAEADAISNSALGLSDSTDYGNAYLVIFDTATVTDSSKFFVSKEAALVTLTGDNAAKVTFGSQATNSKVAGNWGTVATPEPTSGILLLLGMAGLALKRKRA